MRTEDSGGALTSPYLHIVTWTAPCYQRSHPMGWRSQHYSTRGFWRRSWLGAGYQTPKPPSQCPLVCISFSGDIQSSPECDPVQCALGDPAWGECWTKWSLEVPSNLTHVLPCFCESCCKQSPHVPTSVQTFWDGGTAPHMGFPTKAGGNVFPYEKDTPAACPRHVYGAQLQCP